MKENVFIDTDVIFGACKVKIWKNLLEIYKIYTVEKVVDECNPTPLPQKKDFIPVDMNLLKSKVNILAVNDIQRANLVTNPDMVSLHAGERDLLSAVLEWKDDFMLCIADFALINAALILHLKDNLISLEELSKDRKIKDKLKNQFTKNGLSRNITKFVMARLKEV